MMDGLKEAMDVTQDLAMNSAYYLCSEVQAGRDNESPRAHPAMPPEAPILASCTQSYGSWTS